MGSKWLFKDVDAGIEPVSEEELLRVRELAARAVQAVFADLGLPVIDPAHDRVMICGSPAMLRDLKHMLEQRGFKEGNTSTPGDFVIERAFAEQ